MVDPQNNFKRTVTRDVERLERYNRTIEAYGTFFKETLPEKIWPKNVKSTVDAKPHTTFEEPFTINVKNKNYEIVQFRVFTVLFLFLYLLLVITKCILVILSRFLNQRVWRRFLWHMQEALG